MIKTMLLAGLGGFGGTCLRFLVNRLCSIWFAGTFPIATLTVNLAGCLAFGLFSGLAERGNLLTSSQVALLITGFCGGFTTFSTFAGDICNLGDKGEWTVSAVYLAASVILGILLVFTGRQLIR